MRMQAPIFRPPPTTQIDVDDFERCDLDLSNELGFCYYTWGHRFGERGAAAYQQGDLRLSRCYWLLADACCLQLRPDNINDPLQPGSIDESGHPRTVAALTDDVDLLAGAYPRIESPLLRARLADICWLVRRPKRDRKDAFAAIQAYTHDPIDADSWLEDCGEARWRRGARLALQLGQPGKPEADRIIRMLREVVMEELAPGGETKVALSATRILVGLPVDSTELASTADLLAARAEEFQVKSEWHFATHHLSLAKEIFQSQRNADRAADMAVLKAEVHTAEAEARKSGSSPGFMAAADFYNDAIEELRTIPKNLRLARGVADRLDKLHALMKEAQTRSIDELGIFHTQPVDISQTRRASVEAVSGLGPIEAVVQFATLLPWVSQEAARIDALESLRAHSFGRIFETRHLALDGRTVRRTPPATDLTDTSTGNESIFSKMVQHHHFRLRYVVPSTIIPAWQQVVLEHMVEEQDLFDICSQSSAVPRGREWLVAKGLKAGFDGDFTVALHLLTPQLEHILRTQLGLAGVKTVKVENGISMENGLSNLAKLPETECILGPDCTFELRALFCEHAGPNLRNELAHGLLGAGATGGAESVYAWWFMLRLIVLCQAEVSGVTQSN